MAATELTICSVSHFGAPLLRLNAWLLRAVDPGARPRWIVVENTPSASDRLREGEEGFEVVPAARPEGAPAPPPSLDHGEGLNRAVAQARSRFVLVLDPDFYIVWPRWTTAVLEHMARRDLAFFGAPWHPKWFIKYRYFPCVHCMFIDTRRIDPAGLDFRPGLDAGAATPPRPRGRPAPRPPGRLARLARAASALPRLLDPVRRRAIGRSRDTGWNVFRTHGADPRVRRECLVPVWRDRDAFHGPPFGRSQLGEWIETLLPDRYRYVPGRPDAYAATGFVERGWPDPSALGAEEFLWENAPFGFHLRNFARAEARTDLAADLAGVEELIRKVGLRAKPAPPA